MTGETMIAVRGLRKAYGSHPVLDGVDISVPRGNIFALLGPNGAGKTTAVNVLSTLVRPDAGEVVIGGIDVLRDPVATRRVIALTGQYASVDGFQTGEENLVMMGRLAHLGARGARRRAAELLGRFGLEEAARRRVDAYSGGMRRRLDLAISLIASPPVLFLDEPTTGLDPRSRNDLWDVVRHLADEGTTILLTTQYLEEADRLADTVAVLDAGRIIAQGAPDVLKGRLSGDHIELRFANEEDFAAAGALSLADAVLDPEARSLRVPATEPVRTIQALLAATDRAGIPGGGPEHHQADARRRVPRIDRTRHPGQRVRRHRQ
jgi:ABC-type multidrug transport system, ATPase component